LSAQRCRLFTDAIEAGRARPAKMKAMRARQRLDALTGIRPFASVAVFFFHFGRPALDGGPAWLRALGGSGFVGVSFFYVLSGFVLTLGHRQPLVEGTFVARRFFARRLARVIPAAFLALALLLPMALYAPWGRATGAFPSAGAPPWLTALLHLGFVQAWFPSLALTWNLPAWSVSVELAFYLVFPMLARALLRGGARAQHATMLGAWAASLLLSIGYTLVHPDAGVIGPDTQARFLDLLKFWPPLRLPEFVFGVALGACWAPSWRPPRRLAPVALAATALVLASGRVPYPVLHNSLLMPAFGALLVSVASARGAVKRALASRPLVRLGKAGYAIYILQMPLMYLLMLASSAGLVGWRGGGFVARFAVVVLAVALVVHRCVECPLQPRLEAWLMSILYKHAAAPASVKTTNA
jgi:peptidoglycan/LPS O-acetylase OafA/YrhL